MKFNRTGTTLEISLEGAIGESTPMFTLPLESTKEIRVDLAKVTYMNSIGVKQWILWTVKIPKDCKVLLFNCPFLFASQASMVVGFAPKNMTIESLKLPYACEACGFEELYLAHRGKDYEYAEAGHPGQVTAPKKDPVPNVGPVS